MPTESPSCFPESHNSDTTDSDFIYSSHSETSIDLSLNDDETSLSTSISNQPSTLSDHDGFDSLLDYGNETYPSYSEPENDAIIEMPSHADIIILSDDENNSNRSVRNIVGNLVERTSRFNAARNESNSEEEMVESNSTRRNANANSGSRKRRLPASGGSPSPQRSPIDIVDLTLSPPFIRNSLVSFPRLLPITQKIINFFLNLIFFKASKPFVRFFALTGFACKIVSIDSFCLYNPIF